MSKSRQKYFGICISLLTILILFLILEGYARIKYYYFVVPAQRKFLYQELGDKAVDFINFDFEKNKGGLQYYDYHLYANAPHKSKAATFTEYFSSRNVPGSYPLGTGDIIIWLFGGSTMQNLETIDKFTIANSIANNLKKQNIKATVFNFGVGAFQSSLESIKFQDLLRRTDRAQKPDFVIFYDGFNDAYYSYLAGPGNIQNDLSGKMDALVSGKNLKLFIYSFSNILSQFSILWRDHMKLRIEWSFFCKPRVHEDKEDLAKGTKMYLLNTRMIRAICKDLDIKPIFILQPMIYTKKNLTRFENSVKESLDQKHVKFMEDFYGLTREKMRAYDDFIDLSGILDNSKRNDFTDLGHTGPYTGIDIGANIAKIVVSQMLKK